MTLRSIERFLVFSLFMLLLLTVGVVVLAYQISPLRDPNFVPQAANAGATIDWLRIDKIKSWCDRLMQRKVWQQTQPNDREIEVFKQTVQNLVQSQGKNEIIAKVEQS
ncbi:MAG: hypothetical protein QNJ72_06620 [Pleurocapsa sp. MO_226.B13]|nr:hypothetical protein [Pleurocapsa sp. MO_226.B13]